MSSRIAAESCEIMGIFAGTCMTAWRCALGLSVEKRLFSGANFLRQTYSWVWFGDAAGALRDFQRFSKYRPVSRSSGATFA